MKILRALTLIGEAPRAVPSCAARIASAGVVAALTLFAVTGAKADVVKTFKIAATFADSFPGTLSGTVDLDLTNDTATSADLVVTGFPRFNRHPRLDLFPFDASAILSVSDNVDAEDSLDFDFTIPTPGTLTGFQGGMIFNGGAATESGIFAGPFTGSITPVPEPATWALMLLGFLGLGAAGYRQSRRNRAGQRATAA
jgi:hypothetical protein